MRVSKQPEERRKEILNTAMKLFTEKGLEATSMRDIAKEMNVVPGLCYRYFDSKQTLFQEAMDEYVKDCSAQFLRIIHDDSKSFEERFNRLYAAIASEEDTAVYHRFYHQQGNESLHEQLAIKICQYVYPHLLTEVKKWAASTNRKIKNPELLIHFILYGQISILADRQMPMKKNLDCIQHYIDLLFKSETIPE